MRQRLSSNGHVGSNPQWMQTDIPDTGKAAFFADRIFAIEQGEVQGWNRPVAGKISKDPQFQQVSIGIAPLRVAA